MIGKKGLRNVACTVKNVVEGLIMSRDTKDCWECGSELPRTEFYYDRGFPDELYPICTYCISEVKEGKRTLTNEIKGLGKYL